MHSDGVYSTDDSTGGWQIMLPAYLLFLIVGLLIGRVKGREMAGLYLAALLGPIGWAIMAFIPAEPDPEATDNGCLLTLLALLAVSVVLSALAWDPPF